MQMSSSSLNKTLGGGGFVGDDDQDKSRSRSKQTILRARRATSCVGRSANTMQTLIWPRIVVSDADSLDLNPIHCGRDKGMDTQESDNRDAFNTFDAKGLVCFSAGLVVIVGVRLAAAKRIARRGLDQFKCIRHSQVLV